MRRKYYENLKELFFSTPNAERYVAGMEYLVSEQAGRDGEILARQKFIVNVEETKESDDLLPKLAAMSNDSQALDDEALASPVNAAVAEDILAAAYVIHKNFIAKFFTLDDSRDNPELLNRFATAYAALLENFLLLDAESIQDTKFKQTSMDLLNSISNYDKGSEIALALASKIVNCDLPVDFCLAALMQVNVNDDSESKQKVMDIFDTLYSKDLVWNGARTPIGIPISVTPNTPRAMAAMMHTAASKHCSDHAHKGNIAFLFHMQSCWFSTGNTDGCKFIDMCLPAAVAALTMYKNDKAPEWRWVLETLAKYPESSMQRRWRSRIVQNINAQYSGSPDMLNLLGISQNRTCWTWLFSSCSNDFPDEYEPKAVVKGGFTLGSGTGRVHPKRTIS
jgi:hypothetical protein